MSRTMADLLRCLPEDELCSMIGAVLDRRAELNLKDRERLDKLLDASMDVNGFRKAHAAPVKTLAPRVLAKCLETSRSSLPAAVMVAWGRLNDSSTETAATIVKEAGLTPTEFADLLGPFEEWPQGQLQRLVRRLLLRCPGLTKLQAALLLCACGGRFADLRALDGLLAAPEEASDAPSREGSLWQRTLDAARALGPEAPEWAGIDSFLTQVAELAAAKRAEAAASTEAAEAAASGEADLRDALAGLAAVPPVVVAFFGLEREAAVWSAPTSQWLSLQEAASKARELASILNGAEPILRPPATIAERKKQDEFLRTAEEAIRATAAGLAAMLRAPEPLPVGSAEPVLPPTVEAPALPLVVGPGTPVASGPSATEATKEEQSSTIDVVGSAAGEAKVGQGDVPEDIQPEGSASEDKVAPVAQPVLPEALGSYVEFSRAFWISSLGSCEQVPWKADGFKEKLLSGAREAAGQLQLTRLWIENRALEVLDATPFVASSDVRALAELLSAPESPTSGSYPDRSSMLREGEPTASPSRRVALFLEAVRPSRETPLAAERIRALVEAAAYHDTSLRNVVLALLKLGSMGVDPVPRVLAALATNAAAAKYSPTKLEELRAQFHREVVPLLNAAGAKIPRRHCREAWTRFIEQVGPTVRELFPVPKGGAADWSTSDMRSRIGAIVRLHEEIADAAGARFDDRTKMDRAARRIADLAMSVNQAAEALRSQGNQAAREALPVDASRALVNGRPLEAPDEELCRRVLVALATGKPVAQPLGLSLRELLAYPDLLSALHGIRLEATAGPDVIVAGVDEVEDPVRAAAILLGSPLEQGQEGTPPARRLLRLLDVPHRRWLLSRLGAGAGLVPPRSSRLDDEVAVFEEIDRLAASWSYLDELASRGRDQVLGVLNEVRERAAQPTPDFDPILCIDWLGRVRAYSDQSRDKLLSHLASRAKAESRAAAEAALQEGRYGDALHLLQEGPREALVAPSLRETTWRLESKARYPNPLQDIAKEAGDLFDAWRRGITGNVVGTDRQLRSLFADQVLEGRDGKWNQAKAHVIPCEELRKALKPYNPTYIPQLAKFGNLVILTAPTSPKQPNFEHATAGVIDKLGRENLHAVLAPQLSEAGRQATLKEFRRRGLAAAVVDDLDLCRIWNLGGRRPSALIALLEIVLEQQSWSTHFAPFTTQDGQHVQVEMYVGRSVEAEQLTQTPAFSRLFSGRKLGKSALLRYVHDTRDGLRLPSGNALRVLFVPAVGAESDLDIVGRFAEELHLRFNFKVPGLVLDGNPGDALVQIARSFVESRPKESLLVVFDEADKFVEAQLEAYEQHREGCLSFRMRTQIESFRDRSNLPRIRFVFAGYRATSTADGAWANWGDVLRLKPLSLEEGARLIAGPLARMGIDASSQATAIAHRCGCQPVVLLRFGELLLKHLEVRHAPSQREHVVVTAADVAAVFNEEPVREEIRVVVRNNFQDSARARVVFSAMLGVFAGHAPGDGIPEVDRLVLEQLRSIDANLAWLHPSPEAQVLELQRLLKDFAARELVLMRRGADGQPACFLRFPHHLSILLPKDPEGAIREDIAALRRRGQGVLGETARALVGARELDLLREAVCRVPDPHFRIKAAIVGSHWPEAAAHRSGGFADRLGIPPDAVFPPGKASRGLERERMAVIGAADDTVQRISAKRDPHLPAPLFIGGADVLRWALEQQLQTEEMYEIAGLRRLSGPALDWWFQKVRALSFEDLDWREQLVGVTRGVPMFLAEFERVLLNTAEGGVEIGRLRLTQALAGVVAAIPILARSLQVGEPATRLAPRELEILRMLAHVGVATEFKATSLNEDLTECWDDLYRPTLDLPAIDPASRRDRVAVSMLVSLGLAPIGGADRDEDPLRRMVIPAQGDVIYRLAAGLTA